MHSSDGLKAVTKAMKWGHRDQSHGTLFTRAAFLEKNSSLLLWSGVSPELRGAWCKSLNLYMFLCLQGVFEGEQFDAWEIHVNPLCRHDAVLEILMPVDHCTIINRPGFQFKQTANGVVGGRIFFMVPTPTFENQAPRQW